MQTTEKSHQLSPTYCNRLEWKWNYLKEIKTFLGYENTCNIQNVSYAVRKPIFRILMSSTLNDDLTEMNDQHFRQLKVSLPKKKRYRNQFLVDF